MLKYPYKTYLELKKKYVNDISVVKINKNKLILKNMMNSIMILFYFDYQKIIKIFYPKHHCKKLKSNSINNL